MWGAWYHDKPEGGVGIPVDSPPFRRLLKVYRKGVSATCTPLALLVLVLELARAPGQGLPRHIHPPQKKTRQPCAT